ncbi:hypothetical protein [Myroides odoratus]|uniref:GLPGLI family protein n=1 Tax=Myroides odoratus TaxID=256 RepID=A0A378RM69_MYROD|nr:hypothetical protein [Myroides odoratus]QQU05072.1 hypothetical protein I6I89_07265 [Myroides odoratus]STZ27449.1 Uncharacterised protein [Myroides odoratus]
MKNIVLGMAFMLSFGTFANSSDEVYRNEDQVISPRKYCYEMKVIKQYYKNFLSARPSDNFTLNNYCTAAEAKIWGEQVNMKYARETTYNEFTGNGILYLATTVPMQVASSNCFTVANN